MRRVLYSIVIVLITTLTVCAQSQANHQNYGLAFASHEVSKDHRTGLDLNPETPYSFHKDFTVSFDLSLQRLTNAYGYILRVIANDSLNIDLMSTPEHEDFRDLTLVINNMPTDLQFDFTELALKPFQNTTISLTFSFKRNEITLSWNGKTKRHPFIMTDLDQFRFYFGVNDFGKFSTTDAPPVVIRNIVLTENNTPIRKWLLKNHNRTIVYDSIENEVAAVKNPIWLIDRHTRWTHRKSFITGRFPSAAFHSDSAILYMTDERTLYRYDLSREKFVQQNVKGTPVHSDANQLLFVPEKGMLLNYDVLTNKMLSFDFANMTWPNNDTTYYEPNYWHNNKFYNATEDALYTFGGYGHFTYQNTFYKYDETQQKWTAVETNGAVPPRYLAASGLRPATHQVLIFGGYGSMSGKQELSPQSFNDLYTFDLKTHRVEKVRQYAAPQKSEDIAFSNSLVINEDEHCFYVLSFPKNKYEGQVKLRQYSLDSDDSKILADSIPFHFHDEDSFCDLFYAAATQELVAITAHKEGKQYQVDIHTISYPPLRAEDVLQPEHKESRAIANISTILIILGIAGAITLYYYAKRKRAIAIKQETIPVPSDAAVTETRHESDATVTPIPATIPEEHKLTSAVVLFGGFQVFDKAGNDISAKFTMTLKELFALILLHSVKYENGISAAVIQEYMWPDKDEVSARNNRNVNMKKLRTLLDEIGGITVENNNAYLKLTMDDSVYCDYQVVYKLLNHDHHTAEEKEHTINTIIRNVKRGSLLPNIQTTWLDNFKSDISNQIIDTLIEHAQKLDSRKDDKLLLEIADAVFIYDTINQEALVIKCSVLNKKGKYSLAKTWYDHFAKEYKNLYAENYPRTFDEVIS